MSAVTCLNQPECPYEICMHPASALVYLALLSMKLDLYLE